VLNSDDFFYKKKTLKATFYLAAKLAKMQLIIDNVSLKDEAVSLFQSYSNTSYKHFPFLSSNLKEIELEINKVRKVSNTLNSKLSLLRVDQKESILLQTLIIYSSKPYYISYLTYLTEKYNSSKLGSSVSKRLDFFSFCLFVIQMGVLSFAAYFLGKKLYLSLMKFWLTIFFSSFSLWIFVLEVGFVVVNEVYFEKLIIESCLTNIINLFMSKSKLILSRTRYLRDSNALIQHLNPACRVARMTPELPISRFLMMIANYDVTEVPQFEISLSTLPFHFVFAVFNYLPVIAAEIVCNFIVFCSLAVLGCGLFYFASFNYVILVYILSGSFAVALIFLFAKYFAGKYCSNTHKVFIDSPSRENKYKKYLANNSEEEKLDKETDGINESNKSERKKIFNIEPLDPSNGGFPIDDDEGSLTATSHVDQIQLDLKDETPRILADLRPRQKRRKRGQKSSDNHSLEEKNGPGKSLFSEETKLSEETSHAPSNLIEVFNNYENQRVREFNPMKNQCLHSPKKSSKKRRK
jgi:hypothetical protein